MSVWLEQLKSLLVCVFIFCAGILQAQVAHASQFSVAIEQRLMDRNWPFLPHVPRSYQSADDLSLAIGAEFNKFGLEVKRSSFDLELLRSSEPIDVALSARKDSVSLSYKLSDEQKFTLAMSQQEADEQRFECYGFAGITVGSCDASDIQINSSDERYDVLEGDLVGIDAKTSSVGLMFHQQLDLSWFDHWSAGLTSTTHDYNWLTPVEEITSPFILGIKINNITLGDAINGALGTFPQRDSWRLNQVNISAGKSYPIYKNFKVFADTDIAYLYFSNYRAIKATPNYNFKLRAGIRYGTEKLLFEFYGNYYHRNLIGFEPITFNQRTEHHFDRPYGNLGVKMEIRF
jgi:hypothetical protein